jgi:hypothetical protein
MSPGTCVVFRPAFRVNVTLKRLERLNVTFKRNEGPGGLRRLTVVPSRRGVPPVGFEPTPAALLRGLPLPIGLRGRQEVNRIPGHPASP